MAKSKQQELPCDICGRSEAVEVPYCRLYTGGQAVHICANCGFVYVKYRRTAAEIAQAWSTEIYGDGYTARIPAVKARQTYVADFLDVELGLKDQLVFDLGTGEGQFLEIARAQYGARVFGSEASPANCRKLEAAGLPHFQGTIEDYSRSAAARKMQADVVTIMWTLENCASCRAMLDGAYRILKPEGYLAVATGSRLLVPFKKPLHLYLQSTPQDTHAFRFSANTLQAVLAVSGFRVKTVNRYLDSDVLCVIAQKTDRQQPLPWRGDDPRLVHAFFERWHHESIHYLDARPTP